MYLFLSLQSRERKCWSHPLLEVEVEFPELYHGNSRIFFLPFLCVWVCPSFQRTNFVSWTRWKPFSGFCSVVCFSGLLIYWSSELNWLIEGIDMRSEGYCECSAGSGATHFSNRKLVNWLDLSLQTAVYSNSDSLIERKGLFFSPLRWENSYFGFVSFFLPHIELYFFLTCSSSF